MKAEIDLTENRDFRDGGHLISVSAIQRHNDEILSDFDGDIKRLECYNGKLLIRNFLEKFEDPSICICCGRKVFNNYYGTCEECDKYYFDGGTKKKLFLNNEIRSIL